MSQQWQQVDEGWGRRAAEFATLSEPSNCREYAALHHQLGVAEGDRLLDLACGAGLALELARTRGAVCSGIDASERLVRVAVDRNPGCDVRVGDMCALPWDDGCFDVVTSFRGIWGTTPDAVDEAMRVLSPGGRIGLTVWGHIKASSGAWALAPLALAAAERVENQAAMVSLGRPGAGEAALGAAGFEQIRRVEVPFAWEFPDAETYARALASTGPAYEAIQSVGEEEFVRVATEAASAHLREGLPIRAEILVVGYLATKPVRVRSGSGQIARGAGETAGGMGHLAPAPMTEATQALFDDDQETFGFVMNSSRLWAYDPEMVEGLFGLMGRSVTAGKLSMRQRGILVTATASRLGDSYCSLAWGWKLSKEAGDELPAAVLSGADDALDPADRVLAQWARRVVADPNGITSDDVAQLRAAGYDDEQIFGITTFVAFRLAFSTINDALGACPDPGLLDLAPAPVRAAVTYGRAPSG